MLVALRDSLRLTIHGDYLFLKKIYLLQINHIWFIYFGCILAKQCGFVQNAPQLGFCGIFC